MVKQFALLLIGLTLTSCSAFLRFADTALSEATTSTYQNAPYNYALDYPTGWFVEEYDTMTILTSFELGSLPNTHSIPMEHTKIDIYPSATSQAATFEALVAAELLDRECIVGEPVQFTLEYGGQGVEITSLSDIAGLYNLIFVNLEGRHFRIVAFSNLTPVRDIIRSLRAMTPSGATSEQEALDVEALKGDVPQCEQQ